jgi:hypothetical protein
MKKAEAQDFKLAWTPANGLVGNYLIQTAPQFAARLDAQDRHH